MSDDLAAVGASSVASVNNRSSHPNLPSSRASPFPKPSPNAAPAATSSAVSSSTPTPAPVPAASSTAAVASMATPVFLPQSQPFRPSTGAHFMPPMAPRPVGTPFAPSPSAPTAAVIRHLPLNTSEESLRLMVVWSKELIHAELLPVEESDDAGFRSALLKFKTMSGAYEAKKMLDGRSNISNDAAMVVDIVPSSPSSSRRYLAADAPPVVPSGPVASPSSRQASRFNASFQSLEKIAPPANGAGTFVNELPNPEAGSHYQNLFSPQSPIGNHLSERSRMTGKALINNDAADDDETGELLKDPVAYAESGVATVQRRATAPQIPITSRMAGLSLNTASNGPSSLPHYMAASAHPSAMSPVMNGSGPGPGPGPAAGPAMGYPMGNQQQHYQRQNFPPVNPADQNPPCNTLYVGNLPIDTSEEELKAMFSKQRGYKRLCFRTKQNGPMCFVEFEDVTFATKALHELYGQMLHNSVKGGIRLSFSKNPLGVRSGQAPGQSNSSSLGGMSGMMPGSSNGFSAANGPPPGLSAPPGLGSGRMGYGGAGSGASTPSGQQYSVAGFPASSSNIWTTPVYNTAMSSGGGPNGVSNGGSSSYLPPHMMGR